MSERASPRVVIVDPGYASYEIERHVLSPLGVEVVTAWDWTATSRSELLGGADALLVRETPFDRGAIAGLRRCRAIVRYGVGVDNVDVTAARERRIYVANVPDYCEDDVSEHALALLLAVGRRLVTRDGAVRRGAWNVARREPIHRLAGSTLGLIGFGRIGRAMQRKMQGLGIARTLVFDPYVTDVPPGTERVSLEKVCQASDVVSLHAPLTPETRHIIDRSTLRLMKPRAILLNVARGPLVDEAALADALREGRITGAGIDVFEQEPPMLNNPLLALDNVVLSDHTAWYSEESVVTLQTKAAEEVARVLAGEPPRAWVNRW